MAQYPDRCTLTHLSFSAIERAFCGTSFKGILADLGLSTDQIKGGRGFSFNDQELPDMRMDQTRGESVAALLERISPQELYVILKEGGVGSEARSVARAIIQGRPFTSSRDLANVIAAAVPISQQKRGVHPATVSFQALRMAVNEERQEIEQLLLSAERLATVGTRLAIITFHSIEDTLVTRTMRRWENQGSVPANYRGVCVEKSKGKVLTRKPIVPTEDEVRRNPASRSARLRVFEFM
jgi:16S rRNA (cytosine1402-N4)-methyltransferase